MKALLLSWWLLCGADAVSTQHILAHGGREMLLPTQNPYAIDGVVFAQALAGDYAVRRLRQTHPRLAIGVAVGLTAFRGFATAHNVHEVLVYR